MRRVSDPQIGEFDIPGLPVQFSRWPAPAEVKADLLGEQNEAVLQDVLEMVGDPGQSQDAAEG